MNITDPEQIKDVFNKIYDFQKPNVNPLVKLLANGLVSHDGEKWSKHRKIINPAFHLEKLKASFPFLHIESNCAYLVRNIVLQASQVRFIKKKNMI